MLENWGERRDFSCYSNRRTQLWTHQMSLEFFYFFFKRTSTTRNPRWISLGYSCFGYLNFVRLLLQSRLVRVIICPFLNFPIRLGSYFNLRQDRAWVGSHARVLMSTELQKTWRITRDQILKPKLTDMEAFLHHTPLLQHGKRREFS